MPEETFGEFRAGGKGSVLQGTGTCPKGTGRAFSLWLEEVESKKDRGTEE